MRKWILILITMTMLLPLVESATEIQISTDNLTWVDITDESYGGVIGSDLARVGFLDQATRYYIRGRNSTTSWSYLSVRTRMGDEVSMASLGVILFVSGLTFIAFYVGMRFDFFDKKHQLANFIIKRSMIIIAIFLLSMDTVMVATIANTAELGVGKLLFTYMWLINWTAYISMVVLFFAMINGIIKMQNDIAQRKRMGEE